MLNNLIFSELTKVFKTLITVHFINLVVNFSTVDKQVQNPVANFTTIDHNVLNIKILLKTAITGVEIKKAIAITKIVPALRRKVRDILKSTGISAVFVTHDQEEALSISDSLAVMHQGKLEQFATTKFTQTPLLDLLLNL